MLRRNEEAAGWFSGFPHTRRSYHLALSRFLDWYQAAGYESVRRSGVKLPFALSSAPVIVA